MFRYPKTMSSNIFRALTLFALIALTAIDICSSQLSSTLPPAKLNFCPTDCQCVALKSLRLHNHAKCSSIKGLLPEAYHDENGEIGATLLPIHSIDLSHIGLTRISHHLEKLRDVTSIDLSYNDLTEVSHLGRRIKKLNLRHNRISSGKLAKLPHHVQHLDLSHNELTYLPLELTKLMNLQSIELSHNKINCSCETLEVRNWLQQKHVFTENHVKCTYPTDVKGKSWLQIKQSEICEREKNRLIEVDAHENELMLGDQPMVDGSGEQDDDGGELGKDYLPVQGEALKSASYQEEQSTGRSDEVEGSGDLSIQNLPLETHTTEVLIENNADVSTVNEGEEDGSGSGMGPIIIPKITSIRDEDKYDDDEEDSSPSADIFGNGLGIVQFHDTDDKSSESEAIEEKIVPVVYDETQANADSDAAKTEVAPIPNAGENFEKASISSDNENADSKATYYLLGVIVLVVVGLILFVGIKRCKARSHGNYDAESPRSTELINMDKRHPGKPIFKNGTEHAPLIGEKKKEDTARITNGNGTKRPLYDTNDVKDGNTQQPLLNGDKVIHPAESHNESNNNIVPPNEQPKISEPMQVPELYDPNHRIIPRYPPPKSPRASKYSQNTSGGEDNSFSPSSPICGRYSPVYSPETGRVKIKLTETPKPKTPMLVTRSKSNAGDFITTPVKPEIISDALNISDLYQPGDSMTQNQ